MTAYRHPLGLLRGDLVAPRFNPDIRVTVERVAYGRLADALPDSHNRELADSMVRVVFGPDQHGKARKVTVGADELVILVERRGLPVES